MGSQESKVGCSLVHVAGAQRLIWEQRVHLLLSRSKAVLCCSQNKPVHQLPYSQQCLDMEYKHCSGGPAVIAM